QQEQAAAMASQAATVARSITDSYLQARALAGVARALAEAGQHEQAATVARSITSPYLQAHALTVVAGVLADVGQRKQAGAMASRAAILTDSITSSDQLVRALAE